MHYAATFESINQKKQKQKTKQKSVESLQQAI